ncbi:MAG TPA: hypothetical protein VM347_15740 [Nonomuraea sp.]|nr:hypothetical protein [Nonomuraea sp.]
MNRPDTEARWTLLTGHARGLSQLARDPRRRLRDVADLEAAGYLTRVRVGRRNHYSIGADEWSRASR